MCTLVPVQQRWRRLRPCGIFGATSLELVYRQVCLTGVIPNLKMSKYLLKFLEYFASIDPYKEFSQLPRSHQLVALHAKVFCISLIGFFVYVGFSVHVYASTPEASEQTSSSILASSSSTKVLFKLSISVPTNFSECNPYYPQTSYLPHDNFLTKVASSFPLFTGDLELNYDVYPFPVYGTVDSVSGSSTILVFRPCQLLTTFPEKYAEISPLFISLYTDSCSLRSERICNVFGDFLYGSASHVYMNLNLSQGGGPIGVDLSLRKNVSSAGVATYNVSFSGPPSYSPLFTDKQSKQQTIIVTIQPSVTVTTYSPKSILSLLGSISGIFSAFMAISGVISAMIWSRFGVQQVSSSMVGVGVGDSSLQPI